MLPGVAGVGATGVGAGALEVKISNTLIKSALRLVGY
jgi:hypothetical protein